MRADFDAGGAGKDATLRLNPRLKKVDNRNKGGFTGVQLLNPHKVGLEGGVDFFLPTPTETLYLSPKPRSRMRVEFWGQNSTRIGSERVLLNPQIGVSSFPLQSGPGINLFRRGLLNKFINKFI